ncbi:hypothetical protein H5410_031051, partial [Solanum commersonii]
ATIAAFRAVTSSVAPWLCSHTDILVVRGSIVALNVSEGREIETTADLGGNVAAEEPGVSEETRLEVPEGVGAGVGKGSSAGNVFVSTTGEENPSPFAQCGDQHREKREVWRCLARMSISIALSSLKNRLILGRHDRAADEAKPIPRCHIKVLFFNSYPNLKQLGVASDINRANHFFMFSIIFVLILY